MKRLHVHLKVENLEASVAFYSGLFGAEPARLEADYAKWSLAEPAVNFAVSLARGDAGIEHLGIEMDETPAVRATAERVNGAPRADEDGANCCYAVSDKSWLLADGPRRRHPGAVPCPRQSARLRIGQSPARRLLRRLRRAG